MSVKDHVHVIRGRDWPSLPVGVLQHIFGLASTWQKPGSCAAAAVCSTWRAAAAGCSEIRLLYSAGHKGTDESFASWLGSKAGQLGSLILSSSKDSATDLVLGALAQAAEAAAAAGRPLQLRTLRVLGCGPSLAMVGQLAASLPRLSYLQVPDSQESSWKPIPATDSSEIRQQLASLQHATQLQELHLPMKYRVVECSEAIAGVLPPTLQRLSWQASFSEEDVPDLSHLSRLTSLQLGGLKGAALISNKLPEALQELGIGCWERAPSAWSPMPPLKDVPSEQLQLVTRLGRCRLDSDDLSSLSDLRAMDVNAGQLCDTAFSAALSQLTSLSALNVDASKAKPATLQGMVSTATSLQGLRQLSIVLGPNMPPVPGLSGMTGLTQLAVVLDYGEGSVQEHEWWAEELGRMPGLRCLTVPHVLLRLPGHSWLSGLRHLQVLKVPARHVGFWGVEVSQCARRSCKRRMQQVLDGGTLLAAPPGLRLLIVTGIGREEAHPLQLKHQLRLQLVGSSRCEVVVACFDPTEQLAGLPEALQQALA